jgi:hypothetical protein
MGATRQATAPLGAARATAGGPVLPGGGSARSGPGTVAPPQGWPRGGGQPPATAARPTAPISGAQPPGAAARPTAPISGLGAEEPSRRGRRLLLRWGRDAALVTALATALFVANANDPQDVSTAMAAPMLIALAGAVVLGARRAIAGVALGLLFPILLQQPPDALTNPAALRDSHVFGNVASLELAALGLVVLFTGRMAWRDRRPRPLRAAIGLGLGYAALKVLLIVVYLVVKRHFPGAVPLP